jgi:hypothetical protein
MSEPKGYCEVCGAELRPGDKHHKQNICKKCMDEPCRPIVPAPVHHISNEETIREEILGESYLEEEKELPF